MAASLSGRGTHQTTYLAEADQSISSSEASPAKTSPSPASGVASAAALRPLLGNHPTPVRSALFGPASSSSRMSPASFPLAHVVDADTAQRFYAGISDEAMTELRAATAAAGACETARAIRKRHAGTDFAVVCAALANLGYRVSYRILDSRYFGVAQRRRRVFMLAELDTGVSRWTRGTT